MSSPSLSSISVLLLEPDPDLRSALVDLLEGEGATVVAASSDEDARPGFAPAVVVADVEAQGVELPNRLSLRGIAAPVVGLTTNARPESVRDAIRGGYRKLLLKPFDLAAFLLAVTSTVSTPSSLRETLALANAKTDYRFTSLLRFDADDGLTSLWTYDRAEPTFDGFPLDMRVNDSYCVHVRRTGKPFVVTDSEDDARVKDHPKRSELRSYCGVPVRNADGTLFGSLCHFDTAPHPQAAGIVSELQVEADQLDARWLLRRSLSRESSPQ